VSELEFNVPFQHKHGYIRDDFVIIVVLYIIYAVFTDADSTLAINLFSAKDSDQLLSWATCFQYIKQSSSTALSVFSLETSLVQSSLAVFLIFLGLSSSSDLTKLECGGPIPNVMDALANIGGTLCSTTQSLADAHYVTALQ